MNLWTCQMLTSQNTMTVLMLENIRLPSGRRRTRFHNVTMPVMIALMSNGNTYVCLRHDFTCIQLRSLNLILLLEFQFSFVLAILTWTIKLRPNVFLNRTLIERSDSCQLSRVLIKYSIID